MIGEVHDFIRITDQRAGIAGDEILAVADADDQRTARAGYDQEIGKITKQHGDAVRAFELF